MVDGKLSFFVDGGGERVLCFCDESSESGASRLERGLRSLSNAVQHLGLKRLCVESIDGENARSSPLAAAFVRAGFRAGYRGLELDRLADHSNPVSVDNR